ncbi:MAG: aminopeptidase, partial [Bacteroidota bacterium]
FEAYINILAPFKLRNTRPYPERALIRQRAMKNLMKTYFERTGNLSLKRSLCLFPCQALANEADMSLAEYTEFVFKGCKLDQDDPRAAWLAVRERQQRVVDYLNACSEFRYVNATTDISFTTKGRTWINSDGRTNMPSGEVYTSPEEDSVEGKIYFDYPAIRNGKEVKGVSLKVSGGEIREWSAEVGQSVLDETFEIPGTRRFGEAAIGTNYDINRFSKNILFDEKIGGTVHMAIGQSYLQCGGKNESSVHWDMIADMTRKGEIFADGKIIYRNGRFVEELLF